MNLNQVPSGANGISDGAGCALALARHLADSLDRESPFSAPSDDDDGGSCLTHSSSLESISDRLSLPDNDSRPDQISKSKKTNGDCSSFGSTTSCSEESFVLGHCHSPSMQRSDATVPSNKTVEEAKDLSQCLSKICSDLQSLDSLMPVVDFEKLETRWMKAAKDRDMAQRRMLMSEQVRRRLAMEDGDEPGWFSRTSQNRASLGSKLQSGMNLQVCFVNDSQPETEEEEGGLYKSQSTPNFCAIHEPEELGVAHCTMSASQLRRIKEAAEDVDFASRQKRLEKEALLLLTKAQEAARMQMEVERQARQSAPSTLTSLVGIPMSQQKKLSRSQLTKMSTTCLQIILNDLHTKIREHNDELMQLLVQKDTLYMEQDSKLVDIADLLQHHKVDSSTLNSNAINDLAIGKSKYEKILKLFRRL